MRILGIDPGSVVCGYGVIDVEGSTMTLVEYGVVAVKRRTSSFPARLREIHDRLAAVIERTSPDVCSMEKVFYAKNVLSIVQLAHARGVAMLACAQAGHDPIEYTPMQVKRSVTGRGAAPKDQVQHMVKAILSIEETHEFFDATDALAVAICHAVNGGPPPALKRGGATSKRQAWKDFVEKNPSKVKKS
ncbi:MAG: crossover junction endodeoxyribonuclease RuvC [Candidatus Kapabacteria bacterium]|nr:crossover junction endodeoxyribonuclease RuvC [Candidatus Kapabacteria bacterium]